MNDYLPISKKDMRKRGWDEVDFVYVCGDAYVDHPSFGMAIITRVLEAHGFRIGVICQPDWKDEQSVQVFGRPRLGFLVSAGNMDSMVNHYSVSKKRRPSRRVYSGRRDGKASGSCGGCLWQSDPSKCINRFRSLSEESRPVCADWHIMIIGQTA